MARSPETSRCELRHAPHGGARRECRARTQPKPARSRVDGYVRRPNMPPPPRLAPANPNAHWTAAHRRRTSPTGALDRRPSARARHPPQAHEPHRRTTPTSARPQALRCVLPTSPYPARRLDPPRTARWPAPGRPRRTGMPTPHAPWLPLQAAARPTTASRSRPTCPYPLLCRPFAPHPPNGVTAACRQRHPPPPQWRGKTGPRRLARPCRSMR